MTDPTTTATQATLTSWMDTTNTKVEKTRTVLLFNLGLLGHLDKVWQD